MSLRESLQIKDERWWTRTQRIRTAAELPVETELFDTNAYPLYLRIAPKALQLSQLELGFLAISRKRSADRKTVVRAIASLINK